MKPRGESWSGASVERLSLTRVGKKATLHMDDDPKDYLAANLRSVDELCMLANNV